MAPQFWDSELPYLTVLALALTAALLQARRTERRVYLNTLWLFVGAVAGQAFGMLLFALELPKGGAAVHSIFRIVALIRLAGFAVFRLLLPVLGQRPPRIVEDLVILGAYVAYGFVELRGAGLDLSRRHRACATSAGAPRSSRPATGKRWWCRTASS